MRGSPRGERDVDVTDLVEAQDELAPLAARRDALRRVRAHRGDDVHPVVAIRVAEEDGVDAIFLGVDLGVPDVVLCGQEVAAGEVLDGVAELEEHLLVVAGDRDVVALACHRHEALRARAREDRAAADVGVDARARRLARNFTALEHLDHRLHVVGDLDLVLLPLLLQHRRAVTGDVREPEAAGVVEAALHAVAGGADARQPPRPHAEDLGHRREDDVHDADEVPVHRVVDPPEVGDLGVGVDRDLVEARVVLVERDAHREEGLLVERKPGVGPCRVLAAERAVAPLAAVRPLLVAHAHLLAPVDEEDAQQLVELLEELGRDAVVAETDEADLAERRLELEEERDAARRRTQAVVAE